MLTTKPAYFVSCVLLILIYTTDCFPNDYQSEIVDDTVDTDSETTDIALDSHGNAGICYHDETGGDLRFAFYNGDAWQLEIVDSTNNHDVGQNCAILFDNQDKANIVYYDLTSGTMKHAQQIQNGWELRTVEDGLGFDFLLLPTQRPSLAKDNNGAVGLSFYDIVTRDLVYAEFNNGVWSSETVQSDGDVGRYASLAYDSQNNPVIAYQKFTDWTHAELKIIKQSDGAWQNPEIVDATDGAGSFISLVLDTNDTPHLAYQAYNANSVQSLKYTNKIGGAYHEAITLESGAAAGASVGSYCRMVMGRDGDIHILARYYFFSALFGSANYIKMYNLYFMDSADINSYALLTDRLAVSVAPKYDYAGFGLAIDDDYNLVYSFAIQNLGAWTYSLSAARLTTWTPVVQLTTPSVANHDTQNELFRLSWKDFDPDQNSEIRFAYMNANFEEIAIGNTANTRDANEYVIDFSQVPSGAYFLTAKVSNNNFDTFTTSWSPSEVVVAVREAPEEPIQPEQEQEQEQVQDQEPDQQQQEEEQNDNQNNGENIGENDQQQINDAPAEDQPAVAGNDANAADAENNSTDNENEASESGSTDSNDVSDETAGNPAAAAIASCSLSLSLSQSGIKYSAGSLISFFSLFASLITARQKVVKE